MNKRLPLALYVLLSICSLPSFAQHFPVDAVLENAAAHPCISPEEYELIEQRCQENIRAFKIEPGQANRAVTALNWPLQAAPDLHDCSYYYFSAYVDQNEAAGAFQDYNCGTNTYDGHRGTDIATWPFNFYKMDNDLVAVVAAAPGIILDKHDGEFDRNCSGNNLTANYIIIQHADGSRALYWHLKKNSLTAVAIGQPVLAGQYLAVVGSSGSSSGPHLHFEVWSGSTVATRVDPFAGACNSLNAESWWAAQKAYKETAITRASVHSTDIVVPACPAAETLNESASFEIPFQGPGLPAGYAKFYIFIRHEVAGLTADLSILKPDGSPYLSWTYNSPSDNKIRTWGWSKILPTIPGTYTFQATYNGITCSSTFDIVGPTGTLETRSVPVPILYPNPSKGLVTVDAGTECRGWGMVLYNVLGEVVFQTEIAQDKAEISLNLHSGVYFYQIKNGFEVISIGKLLLQ